MRSQEFLLAAASMLAATGAQAGALSVMPIKLEVVEPGTSASATLRNDGDRPLNAQIRVFRWSQVNGQDKLEPTEDVVASPPIAPCRLAGNSTSGSFAPTRPPYTARRTIGWWWTNCPTRIARRTEPSPSWSATSCRSSSSRRMHLQAQLTWSLSHQNGRNVLSAENAGDKEVRIADLSLGKSLVGKGLAGYVLGHSTKTWPVTKAGAGPVKAQTDKGPLSASLVR